MEISLQATDDLLVTLRSFFKLSEFRLGQRPVIESVMSGRDAMAVMPTGGGKSLCYQLPAMRLGGLVVVISPLISLMKDQVGSLQKLGIPAGALYSGQPDEEKVKVFSGLKTLKTFILFLSPERVQRPGFSDWIKKQKVSFFAIDEAHCISQWGPDFREDYSRLKSLRELCPGVPILALTATATPQVLKDISHRLGLNEPDRHVYGFYRPNLYYQVASCTNEDEKMAYIAQALNQNPQGRIIIYCGTRKQTEEIADKLKGRFGQVGYYHAGLSGEKRSSVQNSFSDGTIRVLTATNAFGMGIDHPDVRLVIHFQMPANIESLYQEMGRGGRDGEPSTCLLLYSKKDKGLQAYFINSSDAEPDIISRRWRALEAITQFAEGGECRHSGILTYFKDTQRLKKCGHCDICDPESKRSIARPQVHLTLQTKSKSDRQKLDLDSPLTGQQELRAEVLKEWRKSYADENDIPAFIVFSNKTLRDLAVKNPKTLDDLMRVYGMGPHKVEHLGKHILAQLSEVET